MNGSDVIWALGFMAVTGSLINGFLLPPKCSMTNGKAVCFHGNVVLRRSPLLCLQGLERVFEMLNPFPRRRQ